MDTKELLKKVRKIEIKTRRLSNHIFGGEYHSTFKGRGMTFSEVRQYRRVLISIFRTFFKSSFVSIAKSCF